MRVVIDTNVFINAAINPHGAPAMVLDAWRDHQYELIISPSILEEVFEVIKRPPYVPVTDGRTKKSRCFSKASNCLG